MLMVVILIALTSPLLQAAVRHACVPNTQFVLNGKMCSCDKNGWWSETNCVSIPRSTCLSGQIIWQGCSRCICQDNGKLTCNHAGCPNEKEDEITVSPIYRNVEMAVTWCTPFKSYYINCSICVCPPSGRTAEAHCATDRFCQKLPPYSSDFLMSVNKSVCIPRVMYLFPCLHCLCSDGGFFISEKCVETCHQPQQIDFTRRCISRTFYKKNCNICWCPDDSIPDDNLCTNSVCRKKIKLKSLKGLNTISNDCQPYSFIEPICFYCSCSADGNVNENACLEQKCLKIKNFRYNVPKKACSPGEMVPICLECFCLRNRTSIKTYCTSACSYQHKISVLEQVLKESYKNRALINIKQIKKKSNNETCDPNAAYLDQGRYCLCPENGYTDFQLCTSITEDLQPLRLSKIVVSNKIHLHQNETCKPNTFIEIECNTCYCSRNGTIDPKWCTNDDCEAKKIIQINHRLVRVSSFASNPIEDTCIPGSISKLDCNFCICPEDGNMQKRACTKNKCSGIDYNENDDKFTCEPLVYYVVDCNICFCPSDGIKNVEKCTKKICEKTFLRSDSCIPGEFFSNDCNVCICPPSGNKMDKVCTNHQCTDTPWKKIFMLSQSVLDSSVSHSKMGKKDVEVCFSGEQFEVGCKICVCPDVGLKSFAVCTEFLCEEQKNMIEIANQNIETDEESISSGLALSRPRRDGETCITYNITDSSERIECTPGSMYIIRCKKCICPYMGGINNFCRPLPKNFYCEQAFPNYNYIPMGRRQEEGNLTNANTTVANSTMNIPPTIEEASHPVDHQRTLYNCTKPGKILDKCFICECDMDLVVIEEDCFQSDAEACKDTMPSFLDRINKVAVG